MTNETTALQDAFVAMSVMMGVVFIFAVLVLRLFTRWFKRKYGIGYTSPSITDVFKK